MRLEAQLAEIVARSGLVPLAELQRAEAAALEVHARLDRVLLEFGLVTEAQLRELLRTELGVPDFLPITGLPAAIEAGLPLGFLAAKWVVPLSLDEASIRLGMVDPFDDFAARAVGLKTGRDVVRIRMERSEFEAIWASVYPEHLLHADPAATPAGSDVTPSAADLDGLRDSASDAPVVRFVQEMLRAAVATDASDIHLKPTPRGAEMAFRIDGRLERRSPPDARSFAAVVSRLKILANLDIAERRLPQDGKLTASIGGQSTDIRISTMAHVHGEGVVLRILSRQLTRTSLHDLGFSPQVDAGLATLARLTEGLVLVTGPTGSGKSTTLHALLHQVARPDLNVVTVEDPVEHKIDGISQIQVDEKAGLTFPRILRSLLRQDPDIILIGEIRDTETASIAVQAALTGHLVLATLHTNSALAAVPRLIDMGVEPYLLASVLRGVLAQRLVRRRCNAPTHRSPVRGNEAACPVCSGSGYVGRVAIGELALLDEEYIEALSKAPTLTPSLDLKLRARGFRPMREDALARLETGEIANDDLAAVA